MMRSQRVAGMSSSATMGMRSRLVSARSSQRARSPMSFFCCRSVTSSFSYPSRAFKEVVDMTNRVALIDRYEDRSTCALEMLKLVSDSLPADDDDMTFDAFRFRRGESVLVRGKASERESWRQLEQALRTAQTPSPDSDEVDEDAPPLFAEVNPKDGSQNREGKFPFSIEAKFPAREDEDSKGRKSK